MGSGRESEEVACGVTTGVAIPVAATRSELGAATAASANTVLPSRMTGVFSGGGYKQLGAGGQGAKGRLRGDHQTKHDTLGNVSHVVSCGESVSRQGAKDETPWL